MKNEIIVGLILCVICLIILVYFLYMIIFVNNRVYPCNNTVAIATLCRSPHALKSWIKYHRDFGIQHIYLYVHDPNEVDDIRRNSIMNDNDFVTIIPLTESWKKSKNASSSLDNIKNIFALQNCVVNDALKRAEKSGFGWVVHIDSDELLYSLSGKKSIFKDIPSDRVKINNWEMAPEKDNYENCFKEVTKFRSSGQNFIAYANGKSAGRVGYTAANGPHEFRSLSSYLRPPMYRIPPEDLVVLHYPGCNIHELQKKYEMLGNFSNKHVWGVDNFNQRAKNLFLECSKFDSVDRRNVCKHDVAKKLFAQRLYSNDEKDIVSIIL